MKIEFEITDFPIGEQIKYTTAYLEGILKIYIRSILFFNQPGILLVEYAIVINKWLNKVKEGAIIDFVYDTMDHDQPILSIILVKNEYYKIDSIWKEEEVNTLLSKAELINVFEKYLNDLNHNLKMKSNINLRDIINDLDNTK
jgi:hypothetical protein